MRGGSLLNLRLAEKDELVVMMIKGNIFCSGHVVLEFMIPFKNDKTEKVGSQLRASEDQTGLFRDLLRRIQWVMEKRGLGEIVLIFKYSFSKHYIQISGN